MNANNQLSLPRIDPWVEARKAATPGAILIRVILTDKTIQQAFVEIPRTPKNVAAGLDMQDGTTYFNRADYTIDQRAADLMWQPDHAGAPA